MPTLLDTLLDSTGDLAAIGAFHYCLMPDFDANAILASARAGDPASAHGYTDGDAQAARQHVDILRSMKTFTPLAYLDYSDSLESIRKRAAGLNEEQFTALMIEAARLLRTASRDALRKAA